MCRYITGQPSFFENEKNLFTDEMFRDGAYRLNVEIKEYEGIVPKMVMSGDLLRGYNLLRGASVSSQ